MEITNRRQLRTRTRAWPPVLARALAAAGATPNQVSVASVAFAAVAGSALAIAGTRAAAAVGSGVGAGVAALSLVVAAAGIQLRLLCNMLDGLLAIEGGLRSPTGDLYNEIPDRVGDILILLGAGCALRALPWGLALGWSAALLAVLTAYVRLLGGSLGLVQDFTGPMAKQHRMFALTLGALVAAVEVSMHGTLWSLWAALAVICLGAAVTLVRRTRRIARALAAR